MNTCPRFLVRCVRALALALLVVVASASTMNAQLSGTYTIGSGGTYATFTAAVSALAAGVSGPVTFNVISGTYTEQISIPAITGSSATNTVTFKAQSGNAADAVLRFTPTSGANYIVLLNGADFVTFTRMTFAVQGAGSYGVIFKFTGDANNVTISNSVLNGISVNTSATQYADILIDNQAVDQLTVSGNTITNGSYGIYFDGVNTSTRSDSTRVLNNTFNTIGYAAVALNSMNTSDVSGNTINGANVRGIQLLYCQNDSRVTNNKMTDVGQYGIFLQYSNGGTGFPPQGLVANNMITVGPNGAGIYVYQCTNQYVYYNSVYVTGGNASAYAGSYNAASVSLLNNVLANFGGGYATYLYSSSEALDNNDLYTTGNYLARSTNTEYTDLAAWQSGTGKEAASVSYYPNFWASNDLHTGSTWLNAKAQPVGEVTTDIDGNARNGATPDIGADEYTPTDLSPLSGAYSVGAAQTFTTFRAAASALMSRGVSGPVTFNVINGTYNDHFVLLNVPGSSETNTITFQSSTNVTAGVTLVYNATVSDSNYVVQLINADYVKFHKMTIRSNNNTGATYSIGFYLSGGVDNFTLDSCNVFGYSAANSSQNYTVVYANNVRGSNPTFTGNTFNAGGYAIYWDGISNALPTAGTTVQGNTFLNQGYCGIFLRYHDRPQITGNTITGSGNRGMEIDYCHNDILIAKNKVTGAANYGIMLQYSNGGTGFPPQGLVANNFIQQASNGAGLQIYQCTNQLVYNNSVNVTGGNSEAYYDAYSNATVSVQNNSFVNFGGGYAVYTYSSADVMDFNNLFTTGNVIARATNTDYANLAAWQSGTAREGNGLSVYPSYTSSTNLHSGSTFLNARGTPLAEVFDDIDGDARDGATPDIGADEYVPSVQPPLSGPYNIGAGQTFTNFRNAASALLSRGVSGPVTFNVLNGTYNEHITLYSIPGASETNTVTFQSSSNVTAGVTMVFNAAAPESNYVVQLVNADYVKFHKMTIRSNNNTGATYSIVFYLSGGVDNFTLDSCNVVGYSAANSSQNYTLVYASGVRGSNPTFTGNTFNGGGYGIYWDGDGNTVPTQGTTLSGNTFLNQSYCGAFLRYHDRPQVLGNTFTGAPNRALEIDYCHNDLVVSKNKIASSGAYGIMVQYSNGGSGFPAQGLIANNFVQVGANSAGIQIYQSTNQFIYNNSVHVTGGSSQAYYDAYSNATISVKNNIFANFGGGYAVYTYSSADVMDYNDLFTIGNMIGRSTNTEYPDLEAWQLGTAREAAGISANPVYTSTTNLHSASHFVDARGVTLAEVFDDIDGEPRDGATPDIGADEFAPDVATIPLAGPYTIGSGGSYPNFHAAVNALNARGVSDAVTFNVLPGTYQESIVFYPIAGTSEAFPVTFQSQSGSPVGTTLAALTTAESSYVTLFYGTDHLRFKNLSFRANTNVGASYGIVFYLYGSVDDFQVERCIIGGVPSSNSSVNYALVYGASAYTRDVRFTGNVFNDGGYGCYLDGVGTGQPSTGTVFAGNTFNNQDYAGVWMRYQDAPVVRGNTILNADSRGVELDYCLNGVEVTKNRILTDGSSAYGVYMVFSTGTVGNPGVIANNFVTASGPSSYGLANYYSNYQRFLYNSVNMLSTSSYPLYCYGGSGNASDFLNNSLVNAGGGYALYVASPEGVGLMDYSNFYTTGATLAYWAGDRTTLVNLQSASSKCASARTTPPGYYSPTNLHSTAAGLDSAGTASTLVTDDIDSEPRDANKPDIGADEYSIVITAQATVANGWNMISLPLSVTDNRKTILFPTSVSSAFAYEPPAGYIQRDSFRTMVGYWLKFPSTQSIGVEGSPMLRDSATTRAGWNLIGSIAVPVPRTAIIQNPPANVASSYFEYIVGTGYVQADTLKPGKAFWVKTNLAGKLTLDVAVIPPKTLVGGPDDRQAAIEGLNELAFQAEDGPAAARLYFGMAPAAMIDLDAYALPPAPPVEAADVRFDNDRYVQLLSGTSDREVPVLLQGEGASFRMRWTMKEALGMEYVLVERTGATITRTVALRGEGSVTVSSAKRYAIRIQELPTTFALAQNYPNPFNPSTTVRFDLPEAATVTLRIFTMLGQEIAAPLENAAMDRGTHTAVLDARSWASGTYICRLQAVDAAGKAMSATRKMLLLK